MATGTSRQAPTKASGGDITLVLERAGAAPVKVMADASSGVDASRPVEVGATYRLTGRRRPAGHAHGRPRRLRLWVRDAADVVASPGRPDRQRRRRSRRSAEALADPPSRRPRPRRRSPSSRSRARSRVTDRAVAIDAVVTAPATLLDATRRRIVVQDATGAIEVLLPDGRRRAAGRGPGPGRGQGRAGVRRAAARGRRRVARQGSAAVPAPARRCTARPSEAHEWRLVTVSGRIDERPQARRPLAGGAARRHGDRSWSSASPAPASRSRRSSRAATRRRSASSGGRIPTATDRRFAVLPRSPADVRVAATGGSAGGRDRRDAGTAVEPVRPARPAAGRRPDRESVGAAATGVPDADLVDLAAFVGRTVRVGGLVVELARRRVHARRRHRHRPGRPPGRGRRAARPHRAGDAINVDRPRRVATDGPVVVVDRRAGAVSLAGDDRGGGPASSGAASLGRRRPVASSRPATASAAGLAPFPADGRRRGRRRASASLARDRRPRRSLVTLLRRRHRAAPSGGPRSPSDWPRSRRPVAARPAATGPARRARLSTIHARSTRLDARENAGLSSAEFRASEARHLSEGEVLPNADTRVENPRIAGSRSQPENGSTTSDSAQASWPSTSSSPVTPIGPPGSPRASTRSSCEHRHREFASVTGHVPRPAGLGRLDRASARTTSRSWWRRSWRSRSARPSSGSVPAGRSSRRCSLGDLVITTGAVRLEATTSFFVHDGYPAVADYEAVAALIEAAERLGHRYHVGVTATAPGFFGAQGRPIPQLPIRYPDLAEEMARQRVMNFEMEASALLVLASLARCRAGVVCAVYANRTTGEFVSGDAKDAAEAACVETGLESLLVLAEMDRQKREAGTDRWRPSLWQER